MPEGDTIHRTATVLQRAIAGQTIAEATLRDPLFEVSAIIGQQIPRVEPRGKNVVMHLSGGGALHSHMGMTGAWHLYKPGEEWHKAPKNAVLTMRFDEWLAVCFTPKLLALLSADELRRHDHLQGLGPDLLGPHFDVAEALRRFRAHNQLPLGEAVMQQSIVAGIGNIYKAELLFLHKLDPFSPVAAYSDEELRGLLAEGQKRLAHNLGGHLRQLRFAGDGQRMWAYGRSGKSCFKCGATIQIRRQGDQGRTTYWCATCQPARVIGDR
jgi:endonuclease VIII